MEVFLSFWGYFVQTAPYLLLGLGAAGLVHGFVNVTFIKSHLGGKGLVPVLKASFFGIPLPLCSCSVIPTAVELRKSGAGNASTSSFLISTPESGVDSIAVTYAMMDLPMTILRPLAAFLTSLVAGVFQNSFNFYEVPQSLASEKTCCKKAMAGSKEGKVRENRLIKALKYGYLDLADDLAVWLSIGLVLGGLLGFFLPHNFFDGLNGWAGRLLILGVGIPVYICASASTPIAAALVIKGMSPGTALILLLVGPATNVSNIAVLQKYIGKKGVGINVAVIGIVSLALSYLVDFLYMKFSWPLDFQINHTHDELISPLGHALAAFLVLLLIKGIYKAKVQPLLKSLQKREAP